MGDFWTSQSGDTRGWILSAVSGVACVLGSSIICIDLVTRHIPRWKHFSIRENSTFLSASLSLSFGVMIFSGLYGILPEASVYLIKGGKSPQTAKFMAIGFFMLGVVGLSIVSEILHRSLPSSIVHCEHGGGNKEHDHGDEGFSDTDEEHDHGHEHYHDEQPHEPQVVIARIQTDGSGLPAMSETTPLLPTTSKTPSLKVRLSGSVVSLVAGKIPCTSDSTCYGFSESRPCDRMCLAHIKAARTSRGGSASEGGGGQSTTDLVLEIEQDMEQGMARRESSEHSHDAHGHGGHGGGPGRSAGAGGVHSGHAGHHHVPKNEFLSIGLQTSLAIALHKIPEGFITFATNHANPRLGFAVFLALAIHNLSEGFVMSLPLFLAFKSRMTAILWASLLGGLSQPAGALCAFLWFRSASDGTGDGVEGDKTNVVYGVLFAVTAGIMCNVALQLYGQAVGIYHSQRLPMVCAFVGMGVLGVSFAMTEG